MLKCCREMKLWCAGILCGMMIVYCTTYFILYSIFLEPYCSIKKALYSNGISRLGESQIYTYGPIRSSSCSKNLIAILTPELPLKLVKILQFLDLNFVDNFTTAILIMHSDDLHKPDLLRLSETSKRQILFLNVGHAFNLFPIGFNPCHTKTSFRIRGKWNYQHMIRFWFKVLFELPQLHKYEYIMRLDDDSKLTGKWINVFHEMRHKNAVYFANNIDEDTEGYLPGTMNLKRITLEYVQQNNITPKQPDVLYNAFGNNTVRNYFNNFEVTKVDFFRRQEIVHWVKTIDSKHGIFKYRWGDAVLRYLTLALFAEKQQVLHRNEYNLPYCHKC